MDNANNINGLLDTLLKSGELKNDAALAKTLQVAPPVISKLRHGRLPLGPSLILRMHEKLNVPVSQIREFVPA